MKIVYASPSEATIEIANNIQESMEYGSVLLLVSSGCEPDIIARIRSAVRPRNNLTIGLLDENYGEVGHTNSYWGKLISSGLDTKNIRLLPVIKQNESIQNACQDYRNRLHEAISKHDTVIGIFDIGADGKTAGILPDSPALKSHEIVTYFNTRNCSHITISPVALRLFSNAFILGYTSNPGEDRIDILRKDYPTTNCPVQTLKQIENLVVLTPYNN